MSRLMDFLKKKFEKLKMANAIQPISSSDVERLLTPSSPTSVLSSLKDRDWFAIGQKEATDAHWSTIIFKAKADSIKTEYEQACVDAHGQGQQFARQKIKELEEQKSAAEDEISKLDLKRNDLRKEIVNDENRLARGPQSTNIQGDKFKKQLYLFFVFVLSIFLLLFYSSVLNKALLNPPVAGMSSGVKGVGLATTMIDARTLLNIWQNPEQGPLTAFFILAISFLFVSLGFATHDFFKMKKYLQASLLLVFTILLDLSLAYKLVQEIVVMREMMGIPYPDLDRFIDIASIAVLGFGGYILWGIMFNKYMEQRDYDRPAQVEQEGWSHERKIIEVQVRDKTKNLEMIEADVLELKRRIDGCSIEKDRLENLLNSTIPLFPEILTHCLSDYLRGWVNTSGNQLAKAQTDVLWDEWNVHYNTLVR